MPLGSVATGVAFGFPLLSLSCVLSFAVHATLYPTRYACDPWPVAFYMGPPVVPPYATFYISPFIVVQLTLNLTINPKPLTDPQVILFSLDAYLCTRACSRHMTLYGYKCQLYVYPARNNEVVFAGHQLVSGAL